MTTEATMNDLDVTDSLDDVAAELYGTPKVEETTEPAKEPDAPEAEAAETTEEADTSEAEEAANEEDDEETPKPKKRTTADRLKAKAAENARLAQELEALRAEIEGLKKPLTEDKPAATTDTGPEKPDPTKFQYGELDPQYLEALADYRADLKIAKFQAQLREQQETERKQEAERRASATLQEKATAIEQAGSSKYADFHELVVEGGQNGEYPLTKEMFELVVETSVPADILYHLATNPEEAASVAKMPVTQQALWFGRMEAKLSVPPPPAPKKTTSAPPPPESFAKGAGAKAAPKYDDLDDPRTLEALERELYGKGRR